MSYFNTIGPILQNGESEQEAMEFLHGYDFSQDEVEPQEIGYAQYVDSYQGIDMYYDYGADYYFFVVNDKVQENTVRNMNKNTIRLTEADLHQIIKGSVERIIRENQEDEGLWQSMKNGANAMRDGWNSFKSRELVDNEDNLVSNVGAKDSEDYMDAVDAQIKKLQNELNYLYKKRKELQKYYHIDNTNRGKGNKLSTPNVSRGLGAGGGASFRKSRLSATNGLGGQANMNKG